MTWLFNNEEVEKALTPEASIAATEQVYQELAEGAAFAMTGSTMMSLSQG